MLRNTVAQTLPMVQSSSPSAVLMASLDYARHQASTREGVLRLRRARRLASLARARISELGFDTLAPPMPPLPSDFVGLDPLRVTVLVPGGGFDADESLIEDFGVVSWLQTRCETYTWSHS